MKANTKWSENGINSHIKKSLIEEKDGTVISVMRGLTFLLCNLYSSLKKLKPITMQILSTLENPTSLPSMGSLFIMSLTPRQILEIGSETVYSNNQTLTTRAWYFFHGLHICKQTS